MKSWSTRLTMLAMLAGIATIAVGLWFPARAAVSCGGTGPADPMLALSTFQMARSPGDLADVLACPERLAMLNTMNRGDLFAFIPAYGAFMLLGIAALAQGRWRQWAISATVLALVADIVETTTQLWIGASWKVLSPAMLPLLALGSGLKFIGIAAAMAALGFTMLRKGWLLALLGGVMVAGALASLRIFQAPGQGSTGLTAALLALFAALPVSAWTRNTRIISARSRGSKRSPGV